MTRHKEFDPDEALRSAVDLFWRRGYEATSVADLVKTLGIGRASIYATFGSKYELYLKALDRYVQERDPGVVEILSQPGSPLAAVRALVHQYVAECQGDQRGCLVVNAAVERLPADAAAGRRVESSWDTLEIALTATLTRARAMGELGPQTDPRALARFLLAVLQGLRVLSKGQPNPDRLRDAAEQALRFLEPEV